MGESSELIFERVWSGLISKRYVMLRAKNKQCERGFTLIELVIASFLGAMVLMGAFVILLGFRQQVRIAWAERAMDQHMYKVTRFLTSEISSAIDHGNHGVVQNNYAVWDLIHGDLTKTPLIKTYTKISGSRTKGLLVNNYRYDPEFPPTFQSGRRGVPMWDRRDNFELIYFGMEFPSEPAAGEARLLVERTQIIVTVRMRYRHREQPTFGFLFGEDYARTRTYQASVFIRNGIVKDAPIMKKIQEAGGGSGGGGTLTTLGWSLSSGKSVEEYLTEKWQQNQSRIRPTRLQ